MKRILLILCCLAASYTLKAQNLPAATQYYFNPIYMNPAATGCGDYCSGLKNKQIAGSGRSRTSFDYVRYTLTDRHQWIGVEGAPQTQTFSYENKNGIAAYGLSFINDKNGDISRRSVGLTYAYRILRVPKKTQPQISFALTISGNQFVVDQTPYTTKPELQSDPAILGTVETITYPDANAGVFIYNQYFHAGLSALQLFRSAIKLDGPNMSENIQQQHYYFDVGGKAWFAKNWNAQVSSVFAFDAYNRKQLDVNTKLSYRGVFSLGASFRNNMTYQYNNFIATVGFRIGAIEFGYAYDFCFPKAFGNSHEFMLSYNVCRGKSKGGNKGIRDVVPCPALGFGAGWD